MSKEKIDWLDSGNYATFPADYDGEVYATPDWVRHPDRYPELKDDLYWFLDHWIIVREDGTPVINGKPEEFEKQLRELISEQ